MKNIPENFVSALDQDVFMHHPVTVVMNGSYVRVDKSQAERDGVRFTPDHQLQKEIDAWKSANPGKVPQEISAASSSAPVRPNAAKIYLRGAKGSGTSSIMMRFTENIFDPTSMASMGIAFKVKTINLDGTDYKTQIWTEENKRFPIADAYNYHNMHAHIIVYDVTKRAEFENVSSFFQELPKGLPVILVGNKCDLPDTDRVISTQEGEELAKQKGCQFFEVSAKKNINIETIFIAALREVREKRLNAERMKASARAMIEVADKAGVEQPRKRNCVIL